MDTDKKLDPEDLKNFLRKNQGFTVDLFAKAQQQEGEEDAREKRRETAFEFSYKPSEIKSYLDRYVIQQEDAKKVLATAVCDHYHHIQGCRGQEDCRDYKKQNIILIGPTGVGKTYLVQNIARLIGVPFVKADATKYSETGYVGGDVEDLIRELVQQADGDLELAQYGIVYIDEIDKIANPSNFLGRDVSGHGVQRGLLKLMEETEVPLRAPNDVASQMQAFMDFQTRGRVERKTINTKHILFIVSGAFNGMIEIIKKRLGSRQIGFMGEKQSADQEYFLFGEARANDFIDYGFEAEFIGRLPVTVHCNPLSVNDLFDILRFSEGSLLKQYKKDFLAYGIDAYFTDGGMRTIAEKAAVERTGARALMTVCEKVFRDYKYQLPDAPEVRELVVDETLVGHPSRTLAELLQNPRMFRGQVVSFKLRRFEEEFQQKYGVPIGFTDAAAKRLMAKAEEAGQDTLEFCDELFRNYEHALNLLQQAPKRNQFLVDEDGIDHPEKALETWIRETYRAKEG